MFFVVQRVRERRGKRNGRRNSPYLWKLSKTQVLLLPPLLLLLLLLIKTFTRMHTFLLRLSLFARMCVWGVFAPQRLIFRFKAKHFHIMLIRTYSHIRVFCFCLCSFLSAIVHVWVCLFLMSVFSFCRRRRRRCLQQTHYETEFASRDHFSSRLTLCVCVRMIFMTAALGCDVVVVLILLFLFYWFSNFIRGLCGFSFVVVVFVYLIAR